MMLILVSFVTFTNTTLATEITSAELQSKGDCGHHLQYWHNNQWTYVTTTFVTYTENGVEYPAYCLDKDLPRSW